MKLTKKEEKLTTAELFAKWLIDGKIDVNRILIVYTNYLEETKRQQNLTITGLVQPLADYITQVPKDREKWDKAKAIYHILKSGVYSGTEFEKKLREMAKEYQYEEDWQGNPIFNNLLKDIK